MGESSSLHASECIFIFIQLFSMEFTFGIRFLREILNLKFKSLKVFSLKSFFSVVAVELLSLSVLVCLFVKG